MIRRSFCFIIITTIILFVFGCNKLNEDNEEFQKIVEDNSFLLFKSEIQRTRVNYFPDKRILLYHFWKKTIFDKNGKLFLHVYPKNKSDLRSNRKKHGFKNISINQNELITDDSLNFYLIKKIPQGIEKIVTGQYIENNRTWFTTTNEISNSSFAGKKNSNTLVKKLENSALDSKKYNFFLKLLFKTMICVYNNESTKQIFFLSKTFENGLLVNTDKLSLKSGKTSKVCSPIVKYGNQKLTLNKENVFSFKKNSFEVHKIKLLNEIDSLTILYKDEIVKIRIR